MSELLSMSQRDLLRLELMQRLEAKQVKQGEVAKQLRLTVRQVRRLQAGFRAEGAPALVSKRRGRPSNNRLEAALRAEVCALLTSRYVGFGPTLAHEKLVEVHHLHLSVESLRQLMVQEGLWRTRTARKPVVHQMRERRAAWGELVQIDGSPHNWFEARGPRASLLVFIDDATGAVQHLQFVPVEDTWSYFEATHSYIQAHGKPVAFYSDKHSIFRPTIKENLNGTGQTQFGRALQQLDIALICANTPQAKGRVERMNQTLQDRLVKELRLLNICDMQTANLYLPTFIAELNERFAVSPHATHDAHRPLRRGENLEQILTLQSTRTLSKNLTLQYENTIYQIQTKRPTYALRNAHVGICENRKGEVTITYKGKNLPYLIHHRHPNQAKIVTSKTVDQHIPQQNRPKRSSPSLGSEHPWRRYSLLRKTNPPVL